MLSKWTQRLLMAVALFLTAAALHAQEAPFYKDIQALKKLDSMAYPAPNSILFTGSSSFRRWTNIEAAFPGYPVVNRAFGGSTLPDVIRYANEVIVPYKPKQIAIYCGDNDLAASDSITPAIVLARFTTLFNLLRQQLPKTHILYVAIKPSPSREKLLPKAIETNTLIRKFLRSKKRTAFADVYYPMLLADGKPDPTLFVEDNLHMNEKGYAIWTRILRPYLKK